MATKARYEEARRQLTATVSADESLDYVGDSGRVALSTARGARSGELRRRRPADTSLALAGDATVAVSPRRGGVPGTFEEPQPEPVPAVDSPPPPPSAERTFVGRPRAPGKLAVEETTVGTPPGYRRDTSFTHRVLGIGKYAPGPLTPGDLTADSLDAIGADLSPIAMQDEVSADDSAAAIAILDAVEEQLPPWPDLGDADGSSDDEGFDTTSEDEYDRAGGQQTDNAATVYEPAVFDWRCPCADTDVQRP